jgi:phenazine biosynthesis protein phzE
MPSSSDRSSHPTDVAATSRGSENLADAATVADLLARLAKGGQPFAVLRRATAPDLPTDVVEAEIHVGDVVALDRLADLPVPGDEPANAGANLLALVPYRQLAERGDACHDDGAPLLALRVASTTRVSAQDLLAALPAYDPDPYTGEFDVTDDAYAESVKRILDSEIGAGEGANFVLHRSFVGRPVDADTNELAMALAAFRRLLREERGSYWTFCVHIGDVAGAGFRTMVGATPERHVSVEGGVALMNPISGTFRKPPGEATIDEMLAFLADSKERDELSMVLDEELKMMAAVSDGAAGGPRRGMRDDVAHLGGRVIGPYLKEMARLAHTEYLIEARTDLDVRDVLRVTMFAPTVTGSPLTNAFRVIARHEPKGRGYYGGVLALIGHDDTGKQTLDAPILIRTAYFDADATVRVPVGATLVRDSDPYGEVRETWAKGAGVLRALGIEVKDGAIAAPTRSATKTQTPARPTADALATTAPKTDESDATNTVARPKFADDLRVQASLAARNDTLATFWLAAQRPTSQVDASLAGRQVLVVDGDDAFTAMLTVLLRGLGLEVVVLPYPDAHALPDEQYDNHDLIVVGPGPGDPRDTSSAKMRTLRHAVARRIATQRPLLAICLGHQITALELGLDVVRRDKPTQGMQREVELYGRRERVGFYNSYYALAPETQREGLDLRYDPATREVFALRTPLISGMQYHPESVLTQHGIDLLREEAVRLLG